MSYSIISQIDHLEVLTEYNKLEPRLVWTEQSVKGRQYGLQYAENEDPGSSALGMLKPYRREEEYRFVNPLIQDTLFEKLIKEYKMYRTRIMWINPYSCYSIHKDTSKRIHIPLITNSECLFVFPDIPKLIHLPVGKIYVVDTTKHHSFCNFSDTARLHIVGCVD